MAARSLLAELKRQESKTNPGRLPGEGGEWCDGMAPAMEPDGSARLQLAAPACPRVCCPPREEPGLAVWTSLPDGPQREPLEMRRL